MDILAWLLISGLIIVALLALLIELLLLPGLSIGGILSVALFASAAYVAYDSLGAGACAVTIAISILLSAGITLWALRSKTWERLSLKSKLSGSVQSSLKDKVSLAQRGVTISRLSPIGQVSINGERYEAKSIEGYVNPKQEVEVVGFEDNTLIVKIIN